MGCVAGGVRACVVAGVPPVPPCLAPTLLSPALPRSLSNLCAAGSSWRQSPTRGATWRPGRCSTCQSCRWCLSGGEGGEGSLCCTTGWKRAFASGAGGRSAQLRGTIHHLALTTGGLAFPAPRLQRAAALLAFQAGTKCGPYAQLFDDERVGAGSVVGGARPCLLACSRQCALPCLPAVSLAKCVFA